MVPQPRRAAPTKKQPVILHEQALPRFFPEDARHDKEEPKGPPVKYYAQDRPNPPAILDFSRYNLKCGALARSHCSSIMEIQIISP